MNSKTKLGIQIFFPNILKWRFRSVQILKKAKKSRLLAFVSITNLHCFFFSTRTKRVMEMLNGDANLYFTAYFIVKSQNALFQCKRLSGPFHLTNKHAALSCPPFWMCNNWRRPQWHRARDCWTIMCLLVIWEK